MADAKPKIATPRSADAGLLYGMRRTLARHHVGEFLKTMLVVAPLTALIWIYAERSQVTEETAQIALDFRASDPSKLAASVIDPSPLMLELKGPNNQISSLKEEFARRAVSGQLVATLPANYDKPGDVTIDVAPLLNSDPAFNSFGVAITKVVPGIVRVKLDPYVERKLTVILPPDVTNVQQVVIAPAEVTVRGPESEMRRLETQIQIDDAGLQPLLRQPGSKPVTALPLKLPSSGRITVNPPKVDVKFEVVASDREIEIRSVPIGVQLPVIFADRWKVTINGQQTVTNVRVRGPAASIARLEPSGPDGEPQQKITAVLRVRQEDVNRGEVSRAVEFTDLPLGVKVVSSEEHRVAFDVRDDAR